MQANDRHARRPRSGMSLLELMVTLAILTVFVSLSVAGFQGMTERQRVGGAQREILLMMQEARQQARASLQPVRLTQWTADEDGRPVTRIRWERLPCDNSWGTTCPRVECATNACGVGACDCGPGVGQPVLLPRGLEASSLDRLCWLGDSARPVAPQGTTVCVEASTPPVLGSLVLRRDGVPDQVMDVDGLTGTVRVVDCTQLPNSPGCS
ncbi:type II secretion system protein GspH [Corallococcus sp. H22C18031201]|uniref:pilus assembly FimT family protein n=1 Tax=Citreicoccus inhibens TaxID=2849499 RepID=UPI000E7528BC|nr:prepilin-type N-terminal cleavage/methylation domain-containing protein [Citreicoccus inhibens]MBU8896351.1 prepilin-type N-terminal cleavage/methylation domain-containing protein [Citreicoccus inhibens]RJS17328.1 type II secretion system protein GspH [Corallococcus sp. H22C18031201]